MKSPLSAFIITSTNIVSSKERMLKSSTEVGPLLNPGFGGNAINIAELQEMSPIHNSFIAFQSLKPKFNGEAEEFWLLILNSTLLLTHSILLTKGTLNYCPVHPRDLFRECLKANAFTFIIAHNHPSLDVNPSVEDIKLTRRLHKLSKLIEIPMADHIIFTDTSYFSFRENNLIFGK